MKPRERVLAAYEFEEPDMVPIYLPTIGSEIGQRIVGTKLITTTFKEFEKLTERYVRTQPNWQETMHDALFPVPKKSTTALEPYLHLGVDITWTGGFISGIWKSRKGRFLDERTVLDGIGCVSKYQEMADGSLKFWYFDGYLKEPSLWETWQYPDASDPVLVENFRWLNRKFGDKICIAGAYQGPWELSWQSISMKSFILNMYKNPLSIKRLLERITDHLEDLVKLLLDSGAEFFVHGDDLADRKGPMMKPQDFERFIVPCQKRLVDQIHKRGGLVMLHTDGTIETLMDMIIKTGFDAVGQFEQPGNDIAKIKKQHGDKITLVGNIDCSHLLPFGSEKDVEETVKKTIEAAAHGGGYLMATATGILQPCKPENLVAMVRATRKYAKYPYSFSHLY